MGNKLKDIFNPNSDYNKELNEKKKVLKHPDDITIVRGRRLTDIESLNLLRGNDFDTTLLSQMEVDGFVFKNGEYVIPYIDIYESSVKNNTGGK